MKDEWLLLVCLNGAVSVAVIWKYHGGEFSSAVARMSGVIVLAVGNIAALWGLQKRSKRGGSSLERRLVASAGALAVASFLLTIFGVSLVKDRIGYAELATSDTPLSSIEPERKRLVVELIRRTAAISQEENKAMAEAQKVPMNPAVYSPESFADQKTIRFHLGAVG